MVSIVTLLANDTCISAQCGNGDPADASGQMAGDNAPAWPGRLDFIAYVTTQPAVRHSTFGSGSRARASYWASVPASPRPCASVSATGAVRGSEPAVRSPSMATLKTAESPPAPRSHRARLFRPTRWHGWPSRSQRSPVRPSAAPPLGEAHPRAGTQGRRRRYSAAGRGQGRRCRGGGGETS